MKPSRLKYLSPRRDSRVIEIIVGQEQVDAKASSAVSKADAKAVSRIRMNANIRGCLVPTATFRVVVGPIRGTLPRSDAPFSLRLGPRLCRLFVRLNIDFGFGEIRELEIRRLLFLQRFIKKGRDVIQPELLGSGFECSVARDLIVLDSLRRSKHAGVANGIVMGLLDDLLPLFNDAVYGRAVLTSGRLVEDAEDFLEPRDLLLGFLPVRSKAVARSPKSPSSPSSAELSEWLSRHSRCL
jgi:hypothetical protein